MATVICRNCGNEVRGKFCTNCGTPVPADTGHAAAGDSGATTVLRAEDLLKMESLGSSEPQGTAPQAPDWNQGSQQGWQSPAGSTPAWGQDPANQQWQASPGTDATGQWQANSGANTAGGWSSTPGADTSTPWEANSGPQYGQTGGASYGQTGAGYSGQQSGFAAPLGQFMAGTSGGPAVAPTTDIGGLFSGAFSTVTSRFTTVVQVSLIFAAVFAVVGLVFGIGAFLSSKVGPLGVLVEIISYVAMIAVGTIPVAAFVNMAQDAQSGTSSNGQELIMRARAILPTLIVALILTALIVAVGNIVIVGGIIASFLLMFVPQAVIVDGHSATGSLGQSFQVVKSNIGSSLAAAIVLWLAMFVAMIPVVIVMLLCLVLLIIPVIGWIIYFAVLGIIIGLISAFTFSYLTLLYNGLKAQAGMAASPTPAAPTGSYSGY